MSMPRAVSITAIPVSFVDCGIGNALVARQGGTMPRQRFDGRAVAAFAFMKRGFPVPSIHRSRV